MHTSMRGVIHLSCVAAFSVLFSCKSDYEKGTDALAVQDHQAALQWFAKVGPSDDNYGNAQEAMGQLYYAKAEAAFYAQDAATARRMAEKVPASCTKSLDAQALLTAVRELTALGRMSGPSVGSGAHGEAGVETHTQAPAPVAPPAGAHKDPLADLESSHEACIERNPTTAGMVQCTDAAYGAWEEEHTKVYGKAMAALGPAGKLALRDAQRRWIAFRDAEFIAIDSVYSRLEGTMYLPMRASERLAILQARVRQLHGYVELLEGPE